MRVMSATLKEIRHQKQRGAASVAWRERRGVRTVTKLTIGLKKNVSPARMRTCKETKTSYTGLTSAAFYFTYSVGPGETLLPLKLEAIN